MRAAIQVPGDPHMHVEDVQQSSMQPDDVVIELAASGICGTDVSALRQRSAGFADLPTVLGHEGAGTVVAVGDDVRRCAVGDRVIAAFVSACGECWFCVRSMSNYCEKNASRTRTVQRADGTTAKTMAGLGTFAELMTVRQDAVVPVRSDLPAEQLALIGCGVTTGVGAVLWTAGVTAGSTVAVFGLGGVGHFVLQGALLAGAERIIAVDPVQAKRDHAKAAGASDVIDPAAGDPVSQIRELTHGRGADYVFEVVGQPAVVLQAYESARTGGTVVVLGKPSAGSTVALPIDTLFRSGKHIMGSLYGSANIREHFPMLVGLAEQGRLDIGSAVSRRIALDDVNVGLRAVEEGEVIRSVVCF